MDDLRPFLYRWGHLEPTIDLDCQGARDLLRRLNQWVPPNGHPADDHVRRFAIEQHAADSEGMVDSIIRELDGLLRLQNIKIFVDELEELFQRLYFEVQRAATTDLDQPGYPERIHASNFRQQATEVAASITRGTEDGAERGGASVLRTQLTAIDLDAGVIGGALELRRGYYWTWRRKTGTEFGKLLHEVYLDIQAICIDESVRRLDGLPASGRALLASILRRVQEIHQLQGLQDRGITLGLAQGMVYFLIGRGRLRLA